MHPNRKTSRDVKILVRKGELACRNSWGGDLWADAKVAPGARDSDDSLLAASPPSKRESQPDQMWLPDAPNLSDQVVPSPPVEDIRINEAAHLEQEDRAEFLRLSPRDAINRAWARSNERKFGKTPASSDPDTTEQDQAQQVDESESTALSSESPDSSDREILRDLVRESTPPVSQTSSDGGDRQITARVPVTEVAVRPHHTAEDKFYEIPEIQPDVELPRLRNQFSLPQKRGSTVTLTPSAKAANQGDSEITSYDRVLQRAQEFRSSKASQINEVTDDRVTSSSIQQETHPTPVDVQGEDEVVHFRAERASLGVRFVAPDEFGDDIDESALEEDYELDRSFRPEETVNQSEHRWWHTIARHRVFKPASGAIETPVTSVEADVANESDVVRSDTDRLAVNWDDPALAPVARARDDISLRSTSGHAWASLDYLDDVTTTDEQLQPLTWREPESMNSDVKSQFASSLPRGHQFDPRSREGMEYLRDQLAGTQDQVNPIPQVTTRRPMTRAQASQSGNSDEERNDTVDVARRHVPELRETPVDPPPDYGYDTEFNPDFDLRLIAAAEIEPPLDMRIMISPEIPRKCATCRSFRAAENGTRGWCTNKWAFAHRPLVDSEDLACDSTIGCWWLPETSAWDPDGFLAKLRVPTPRADALIASLDRPQQRMTS